MRALLLVTFCTLVGCADLNLNNHTVAFACEHGGGDGGKQCAGDWSCGFDDRCFDRQVTDGGVAARDWRCENDTHCPEAWRCGRAVDGKAFCQQLDAGFASQCLTSSDCQANWRCGVDQRCFDPNDTDAGTSRVCVSDAGNQCPERYRCGEQVGGVQHCIEVDAGAPSACTSDFGCEGGWRCDLEAAHCVNVTDTLGGSSLSELVSSVENPQLSLPVPLRIAATRLGMLAPVFLSGQQGGQNTGLMTAALFDAGVLVTAQRTDGTFSGPGGSVLLQRILVPLSGGVATDVTDLALTLDGPAVRFANKHARVLLFDGGVVKLAQDLETTLLRQVEDFSSQNQPSPNHLDVITAAGKSVYFSDGGFTLPFAGTVFEVVEYRPLPLQGQQPPPAPRDDLYVFTDQGAFLVANGATYPLTGTALTSTPLVTVAGALPNQPLMFLMLVDTDGGVPGILPWLSGSVGPGSYLNAPSAPLPACVNGAVPVDLTLTRDPQSQRGNAVVECRNDAGVFGLQLTFEQNNMSFVARPDSFAQDQTAFLRPFVAQRSSAFVRALAGADGRVWQAVDSQSDPGVSILGLETLNPQILDRQPEAIASFTEGGAAQTIAAAGTFAGFLDATGFVTKLKNEGDRPLAVFSNQPNWVVTADRVFDLAGISIAGNPITIASIPTPAFLEAPLSAATQRVRLNGQLRDVMLISSRDTVWAADVTDNVANLFATPAILKAVLVPTPGIGLRSLTVDDSSLDALSGYITTTSKTLRFSTNDLLRWEVKDVSTPPNITLPLEVWTERQSATDGGPALVGRAGHGDGRVWSLPIMVPLTNALPSDAGLASDFARLCGQTFVAASTGLYRARPSTDGGLPWWSPVTQVNAQLDSTTNLRLYETNRNDTGLLYVGTTTGQLIQVSRTGGCPDAG